ncbi:hypothetical protein TYRP_001607 [Tyrophagus putrescentiae]|nr:hypothetical protein TYRP_001607 [Tyrophagus putrescentiae]
MSSSTASAACSTSDAGDQNLEHQQSSSGTKTSLKEVEPAPKNLSQAERPNRLVTDDHDQDHHQDHSEEPPPRYIHYSPVQMMTFFAASHHNIFGSAVTAIGDRLLRAARRRERTSAEVRQEVASVLGIMDRALSRTTYNLLQMMEATDAKLESMVLNGIPEDFEMDEEEEEDEEENEDKGKGSAQNGSSSAAGRHKDDAEK